MFSGQEPSLKLTETLLYAKNRCNNSVNSTFPSLDSISTMDLTFELNNANNSVNFSLDEILLEDEKDIHEEVLQEKDEHSDSFENLYERADRFLEEEGLYIACSDEISHRKFSGHFVQLNFLPTFKNDSGNDFLNGSINSGTSSVMKRRLEARKARSALEMKRDGSGNCLLAGNFNIMKMNSDRGMQHSSA